MSFTIDRQSEDELNLLGKFRQGSVYFLFNQVKTRGGEQLLDQMFRSPLTDAKAINHRTAVFRFFQESAFQFPFDPQQVVQMREYADAAGSGGRCEPWPPSCSKNIELLTRDERYKLLIQGLQATIVTLKRCFDFASALSAIPGPYQQQASAILQLLRMPEMSKLIDTDIYADITVSNIASIRSFVEKQAQQRDQDDPRVHCSIGCEYRCRKYCSRKRAHLCQSSPERSKMF